MLRHVALYMMSACFSPVDVHAAAMQSLEGTHTLMLLGAAIDSRPMSLIKCQRVRSHSLTTAKASLKQPSVVAWALPQSRQL